MNTLLVIGALVFLFLIGHEGNKKHKSPEKSKS